MGKKRGHYMGTEVDEKWWKRYTKAALFTRGNGEYWYDDNAFYFQRYLTKDPLVIPFRVISHLKLGRWHSGRWSWGQPIIKLIWNDQEIVLSSGFVLSKADDEAKEIMANLRERIA